jgi:hypothetical protein
MYFRAKITLKNNRYHTRKHPLKCISMNFKAYEKPNQYLNLVHRFSLPYSILGHIEILYQTPINFMWRDNVTFV